MSKSRRLSFYPHAAFFLLLIIAAFFLTWTFVGPDVPIVESRPKRNQEPQRVSSSGNTPLPVPVQPRPDPRSIDPEIQKLANKLAEQSETPLRDLEIMNEFVDLYRKSFSHLPVGSNEDITAILTGQNPKKGLLFPSDSPMIIKGQIVDRWGTPYWLHPNSGARMEIRSAGPDKNLFSPDDIVLNQSPASLGVTPEEKR
jgi:hypothetical protein